MSNKIILGSQSPRRFSILKKAGFEVQIILPEVDETYPPEIPLEQVPEYLAKLKMEHVCNAFINEDIFIITADTLLLFKGKLISKPIDKTDALQILLSLNNTYHEVITGVCIRKKDKQISFSQTTKVYFKNLTKLDIQNFIDDNDVLDKAGAYNLQEYIGVDRIDGDYDNVVGLPIKTIQQKMKNWK